MNNNLNIIDKDTTNKEIVDLKKHSNAQSIRLLLRALEEEMYEMRRCYRKAELKYSIIPTLKRYLSDLEHLEDEK
jgi:hypothetical protein